MAVSDEDNVPTLSDRVRQRIYQRFGIWGLVGLAVVAAGIYVWTQWDSVKTWPGITPFVAYLSREDLPKADPSRFSVAVVNLEDDRPNGDHKKLIVRLLRDFKGVQVLSFDRIMSVKGAVPEEQQRKGHQRAREYLRESNASVLIWGSVLHHGEQTKPDLYLTAASGQAEKSKQYSVEMGTEFRLPKVFWDDLSDVLRLVITTQDTQFRAKEGHYVADRLQPFIDRVRSLLKARTNRPGWDVDALGSTRVILADALTTLGNQSGRNEPLEEAVAAYREALKERTRERVPLDWAMTQNNLGNALLRLGQCESGTARLEEAVAAYREALTVFETAGATYYASVTQNNLDHARALLAER